MAGKQSGLPLKLDHKARFRPAFPASGFSLFASGFGLLLVARGGQLAASVGLLVGRLVAERLVLAAESVVTFGAAAVDRRGGNEEVNWLLLLCVVLSFLLFFYAACLCPRRLTLIVERPYWRSPEQTNERAREEKTQRFSPGRSSSRLNKAKKQEPPSARFGAPLCFERFRVRVGGGTAGFPLCYARRSSCRREQQAASFESCERRKVQGGQKRRKKFFPNHIHSHSQTSARAAMNSPIVGSIVSPHK